MVSAFYVDSTAGTYDRIYVRKIIDGTSILPTTVAAARTGRPTDPSTYVPSRAAVVVLGHPRP